VSLSICIFTTLEQLHPARGVSARLWGEAVGPWGRGAVGPVGPSSRCSAPLMQVRVRQLGMSWDTEGVPDPTEPGARNRLESHCVRGLSPEIGMATGRVVEHPQLFRGSAKRSWQSLGGTCRVYVIRLAPRLGGPLAVVEGEGVAVRERAGRSTSGSAPCLLAGLHRDIRRGPAQGRASIEACDSVVACSRPCRRFFRAMTLPALPPRARASFIKSRDNARLARRPPRVNHLVSAMNKTST